MELRVSNLAKTYPASGIRKMFDLAAGYDDVIALTLGEPNFETPAYIKEAAKKALDENYTHYAPMAGLPVLREAISLYIPVMIECQIGSDDKVFPMVPAGKPIEEAFDEIDLRIE